MASGSEKRTLGREITRDLIQRSLPLSAHPLFLFQLMAKLMLDGRHLEREKDVIQRSAVVRLQA